jgi:CheY-like chemotaxis protein
MNRKILIVDDELIIREMLHTAFENEGYQAVACGSGAEAIIRLQQEKIRVMFLDLKMPGMDGMEVCWKIKSQNPVTCIYAVTGHVTLFQLAACLEAGFDDYFSKPINIEVLLKAADESFKRLSRWSAMYQTAPNGPVMGKNTAGFQNQHGCP